MERETEANSGDVMMVEAKASSSITNPGSENISTVVIESSQTRGTLADREGFTQGKLKCEDFLCKSEDKFSDF